jgi:hypothetical protein
VLLLAVLIETRHWVDRMGRLVNRVQGAPLLIRFVVALASLMIFFVPLMAEGIAVSTVDGEWWLPADVRLAVCYLALGELFFLLIMALSFEVRQAADQAARAQQTPRKRPSP